MKNYTLYPNIQKDTILIKSIGWGCNVFYKVISRTEKSVKVRELEDEVVTRNIRYQTIDIVAGKNFRNNTEPFILKLASDHIGPRKRLIWWNVWDNKKRNQYSS